jgi:hypothetical protein
MEMALNFEFYINGVSGGRANRDTPFEIGGDRETLEIWCVKESICIPIKMAAIQLNILNKGCHLLRHDCKVDGKRYEIKFTEEK